MTATSGLDSTGNDFGEFQVSTLSGEVFNDLNGNGALDGGEPGLAGWTVNLVNSSSQTVATTTTDSHGDYTFTVDGRRHVHGRGGLQSGYVPTVPASGTYTETPSSGQSVANLELRQLPDGHLQRRGVQRPQRQRRPRGRRAGPRRLDRQPAEQLEPGHRHGHDRLERRLRVHRRRARDLHRSRRSTQTGYVQSSTPATFAETAASGQNVANLDFGEFQTVTLERRGLQRPQRRRHARQRRAGPRRLDRQPAQCLEPGRRHRDHRLQRRLRVHRRRPRLVHDPESSSKRATSRPAPPPTA